MKTISEAMFIACTGSEPQDDDLERCNCQKAGEFGHYFCGWNWEASRPRFEVLEERT